MGLEPQGQAGPAACSETETWNMKEVAAGRRRIRTQAPFRDCDHRGHEPPAHSSLAGPAPNETTSKAPHVAPWTLGPKHPRPAQRDLAPGPCASLRPASHTLGLVSLPRDLHLASGPAPAPGTPKPLARTCSAHAPARTGAPRSGVTGPAPLLRLLGAQPCRNSPPGGAGLARLSRTTTAFARPRPSESH